MNRSGLGLCILMLVAALTAGMVLSSTPESARRSGRADRLRGTSRLPIPSKEPLAPARTVSVMSRLHAPMSWEQVYCAAASPTRSLYAAVDLGRYEYNRPPFEPRDPEPADGATQVDLAPELRWSGGDPDIGDVVTYDLFFGDPSNPPLIAIDLAEPRYQLQPLEPGSVYYWRVQARDALDETTLGPVWSFTTTSDDQEAPSSWFTDPEDGAYLNGFTYRLRGTAGDGDGSGVEMVELSWDDGQTWQTATGTESWHLDWTLPADGLYQLRVRATDRAGNQETPGAGVTVTVDNTPPTIRLAGFYDSELSRSQGGHVVFLAYIPDDDLVAVEICVDHGMGTGAYLVDDGSQGDWEAGDRLYMLAVYGIGPGTPVGRYVAELVATDRAGNESDLWPYLDVRPTRLGRGLPRMATIRGEQDWLEQRRAFLTEGERNGDQPAILATGLWDTRLATDLGGELTLLAVVQDPQQDIQTVEVYYAGLGTGLYLRDDGYGGDWNAGDTLFSWHAPEVGTGVPAGQYLLEIVAIDQTGAEARMAPYLWVDP